MRRVSVVAGVLILFVFIGGAGYSLGATTSESFAGANEPARAPLVPGVSPTDVPEESPSPSPSEPSPSPSEEPAESFTPPDEVMTGPKSSMTKTGTDAVALTFDDGPHPQWTPKVLAKLRETGVRATFCVIGSQAKRYPDLIREIVADGHTLCNHSWHHELDLGEKSPGTIKKNLKRTNAAIRAAVPDADIRYYRQPGGKWTKGIVSVAAELDMIALHWSVDPSDWDSSTKAKQIGQRVVDDVDEGDIVLMHDGGGDRKRTLNALGPILDDLRERFTLEPLPCHESDE